jgi:GT2 family glycosyltransferase
MPSQDNARKIAVLITCFNRREKTLACLRRLADQQLPADHVLQVYLVDDGCTDGTGDAVIREFPRTRVLHGTGSLYWAGGMRFAWVEAAKDQPDYFLLLNDDTEIVPHAVATLLEITGNPAAHVIAVAAIADPATDKIIYGAYRNGITGNLPEDDPKDHCHTFNANCVLVTSAVHQTVGILDAAYTHGMADHDYGYVATHANINIVQSAQTLGSCPPNSKKGTWQDASLPRNRRWELIQRPTGLLWRDWLTYCRRHLGWKWPFYFAGPYLRILLKK